jgi:hypothetical protein
MLAYSCDLMYSFSNKETNTMMNSIMKLIIVITREITIETKYWFVPNEYLFKKILIVKEIPIKMMAMLKIKIFLIILMD